ncbi:MAG: hypothetical protein ACKOPS_07090, partial [Cyanobium sp.]
CLSRSLSGRLLLDWIGVANELHLGMSKFNDGRKVPHAWLRDPLSGRLLLDWFGVPNELHLGMSKFPDGRKVPHAWLRDPDSGRLFTPGLTPGAGAALTHF